MENPGLQRTIVGSGYNLITGQYITIAGAHLSHPIVDMSDLDKVAYDEIDCPFTHIWYTQGKTVKDLMFSFNVNLQSSVKLPLFSGGIEAEFNLKDKKVEEFSFFRFNSYCEKMNQYLKGNAFMNHLTEEFVDALAHEDIDILFKTYGTHLITGVTVGGRLNFSLSYHRKENEQQVEVGTKVNAAFKDIFTASAKSGTSKETKAVLEQSEVLVKAIGGSFDDVPDMEKFGEQYGRWAATLQKKESWVPCGISGVDKCLVPIWTLVFDSTRSDEIEERYHELLYERYSILNTCVEFPKYTDLQLANGVTSSGAKITAPADNDIVHMNLHKNLPESERNKGIAAHQYITYRANEYPSADKIVELVVYKSEKMKLENELIKVNHNGVELKCLPIGSTDPIQHSINRYSDQGRAQYYHLLAATAIHNRTIMHLVTDIKVHYGDSTVPEGYQYVCIAGTKEKANCNYGHGGTAAYILTKKKTFQAREEWSNE